MTTTARERFAAMMPLLAQLEAGATPAHEAGRRLARELLAAHHDGLARALALLAQGPEGPALLRVLAADADVAALLMLHGLHPDDLATRVRRAVEALAPRLAAGHASLELVAIDADGVVRLRLEHGGRRGTWTDAIEEALAAAAADASDVVIDEAVVAPLRFERKAAP